MSAADERETESEVGGSVREALNGYRHKSTTETSTLPAFLFIRNAGKDEKDNFGIFLGFLFFRG